LLLIFDNNTARRTPLFFYHVQEAAVVNLRQAAMVLLW